ncbi:hypothetical protein [Bradyrhizobium sp. HKCCYLS20291]|uniref:hypothetical protein n=1 Tax=Bradyrhizobium sp. HKCCYLS20291 TaxID=3420766 RepID=UPI003EBA5EFD
MLVALHIMSLGIWIGCILTEAAFEHMTGKIHPVAIARLHVAVDTYVETPAFLAVLATGIGLLASANPSPVFWVKIGIGLIAILTNVACVGLVIARDRAFRRDAVADARLMDRWQHRLGGVLALMIVAALSLALYDHAPV